MGFPSALSMINNSVVGSTGRKVLDGPNPVFKVHTIPAGAMLLRDIIYHPPTRSYLVVGGVASAPLPAVAIVLVGKDDVWSFVNTGIVDPLWSVAMNDRTDTAGYGRICISRNALAIGNPIAHFTDDLVNFPACNRLSTINEFNGSAASHRKAMVFGGLNFVTTTFPAAGDGVVLTSGNNGVDWTDRDIMSALSSAVAKNQKIHAGVTANTGIFVSTDNGISFKPWGPTGVTIGSDDIAHNGFLGTIYAHVDAAGNNVPNDAVSNNEGLSATLVYQGINLILPSVCALPSGKFVVTGARGGDGNPVTLVTSADGLTRSFFTFPPGFSFNIPVNGFVSRIRYINGKVWFIGSNSNGTGFIVSASNFF